MDLNSMQEAYLEPRLHPGESIRYENRIKHILKGCGDVPGMVNNDSSPAYAVLVLEEGTVPSDRLVRLQNQKRIWDMSLDINSMPDYD